jgi:transcription elongation factor Elf1
MSRALIKYECPFCHRKIATLIFPEDPQSGLIYCPNCQVYTSLVEETRSWVSAKKPTTSVVW